MTKKTNRTDVLHFGWQAGKFVLLVLSNIGHIKHRISIAPSELFKVRGCMEHGEHDCPKIGTYNSATRSHVLEGHVQIDTDRELGDDVVRFADYAPSKGISLTASAGYFTLSTWRGRAAWSNGHLLLVGDAPKTDLEVRQWDPARFDKVMPADWESKTTTLRPICAQQIASDGDSQPARVMWFDSGFPVDANYFDFIVERYPGAQFRRSKQAFDGGAVNELLLIFENAEATVSIGALMPMRFDPDLIVTELREEQRQHAFAFRGGVGVYYSTATCTDCGRLFSDPIHYHDRYEVRIRQGTAGGLRPGERVDEERIAAVREEARRNVLAAPADFLSPCCLAELDTNSGSRICCAFCRRNVNPVGVITKASSEYIQGGE